MKRRKLNEISSSTPEPEESVSSGETPDQEVSRLIGNLPVVMTTSQPTNNSELQLYRVLMRANLLQYYDIFIAQGGDDVQQLCEAGEEEFLEIMALVGMASKPLHVRRLQKALQEWVANPGADSMTISSFTPPSGEKHQSMQISTVQKFPQSLPSAFQGKSLPQPNTTPGSITAVMRDQQAVLNYQSQTIQPTLVVGASSWTPQSTGPHSVSPTPQDTHSPSSVSPQSDSKDTLMMQQHSSCNSPSLTPVLDEAQINAIAEAAARLAKNLPQYEAKELNPKKQVNKDIHALMSMPEDDPNRMDELRKYAAIYGRFDSRRKNDKPMSLHEISVNEASAQLCRHIPALLTRREELFPLARQVVRDSGYHYSKGHSRAGADLVVPKKNKLDHFSQRVHDPNAKTVKAELSKLVQQEKMLLINEELQKIEIRQEELNLHIQNRIGRDRAQHVAVQGELNTLITKQTELLAQRAAILKRMKHFDRQIKSRDFIILDDNATDSSFIASDGSENNSLGEESNEDGDSAIAVMISSLGKNNPSRRQILAETLFDEGLRIAQQYGMNDFAETLKELERHASNASPSGGQSNPGSEGIKDQEDKDLAQLLERVVPADRASENYLTSSSPYSDNHTRTGIVSSYELHSPMASKNTSIAVDVCNSIGIKSPWRDLESDLVGARVSSGYRQLVNNNLSIDCLPQNTNMDLVVKAENGHQADVLSSIAKRKFPRPHYRTPSSHKQSVVPIKIKKECLENGDSHVVV